MRVVITGATGNVGTALLRALADVPEATEVVGLARRLPEGPEAAALAGGKARFVAADIATDDLAAPLQGADAVVHLAWRIQPSRDERAMERINVEGTRRVFEAAVAAGVRTVVHASSVGAYAPGPKDRRVTEAHPATGIETSAYSRHKAAAEALLDTLEALHGDVRWVRLRPGLVFQRGAASEIRRFFAGPFLPRFAARRGLLPVVPLPARLAVQAVHADDLAQAYVRAVLDDAARGAYNVASEPVLTPQRLAGVLGARRVGLPEGVLRAACDLTWRARLQPTDPGWVDLGLGVPLMDTSRARDELGWREARPATDALAELLDGLRDGAGTATPPLDPHAGGPARVHELRTGVGGAST